MTNNEKKYTVYEIEKLTKGKLTKYKLTKAIQNNELNAEIVKGTKKGRGIPNYFIYESDLQHYLELLEKNKKKFIDVPGDIDENESIFSKSNSQAYSQDISNIICESLELIKEQNQNINELKQRIQFLENESAKIVPLLEKQNKNLENERLKSIKRTELIEELSKTPLIQVNKKQDILNKLKDLG